jgi:1-acyl-sn-glycerol-3-phosphate acyltransferase
VIQAGRRPRFLAKHELFEQPLIGRVLRGARQIPVTRGTRDESSLEEATRALEGGEVVVIYPEGTTTTTDADFSPGRGKTGVVRLALRTGVPVLPVATWGGQYVWRKSGRQSLSFGRPVWLRAGDPIDLVARAGDETTASDVRTLTDGVMDELGRLVAAMRSQYPSRWVRAGA